jgi:arginine utilization protein RocB
MIEEWSKKNLTSKRTDSESYQTRDIEDDSVQVLIVTFPDLLERLRGRMDRTQDEKKHKYNERVVLGQPHVKSAGLLGPATL